MNRRQFFFSTMTSSLGLMACAGSAKAFTALQCDTTNDLACRELVQHHDLLAQINAVLSQKGLGDEQRRVVLAAAMCPFCGLPLVG